MSYQNKRIKFSSKLFCKTYINKITQETVYPFLWRKDYVDFMRKKNGYIVYKITCKVTGLCYIGYTYLKINQRWNAHCNHAFKNNSYYKFSKAIREFGKENWILEVLETFDTAFFAKAYEIYCIDKFDSIKNGYNSTQGGDGTFGLQAMLGREYTNKHCNNISNSLKGKSKSLQHTLANSTPVYQIDKVTGEILNMFLSMKEASHKTGVFHTNISACCLRNCPHAGGFLWRYVHENLTIDDLKQEILIIKQQKNLVKQNYKNYIQNRQNKAIIQLNLFSNIEITTFKSILQASQQTGICYQSISQCCLGRYKHAGGFKWKYAVDYYQ